MNELTMDIGKIELFVKQEEGELLLRARASAKNQQEFESDLNKLRNLLDRLENAKKLTFVFREPLEIPGCFEDHFKKSGIDIEKKITKLQAITNQKIWLMRHGYPNPDSGVLTEEGIERVKKTAAFFKDKNIVIYCSPIARCVQTATILENVVTGVEWHPMSWLGEFEGLPENWLSLLTGETIVIVSHQSRLCKIAGRIVDGFDDFHFSYGWPMELVSTRRGTMIRPLDEAALA